MKIVSNIVFLSFVFLLIITSWIKPAAALTAPNFIYLDWHSSSYAPEEYLNLARPLSSGGAKIELTANLFSVQDKTINKKVVSGFQRLNADNYRITWSINSKKLAEGQGMDRFVYELPRGVNLNRVLVEVSAFNTKVTEPTISRKISLPLVKEPEITVHLLQNNKVLPLAQTVFSGASGQALQLLAKPYFFSSPGLLDLSFAWYQGKQRIENQTDRIFEIQLPGFSTSGFFQSVVYNSDFSLELAQQELKIESK